MLINNFKSIFKVIFFPQQKRAAKKNGIFQEG